MTSIPPGANIYLDNAYKGLTPLNIDVVPNGNHVIVLRLDRYEDLSCTISINGNSLLVNIALIYSPDPDPNGNINHSANGNRAVQPGQTTPVPIGEYGALSITTSPPGCNGVYRWRGKRGHTGNDPRALCGEAFCTPDPGRVHYHEHNDHD